MRPHELDPPISCARGFGESVSWGSGSQRSRGFGGSGSQRIPSLGQSHLAARRGQQVAVEREASRQWRANLGGGGFGEVDLEGWGGQGSEPEGWRAKFGRSRPRRASQHRGR